MYHPRMALAAALSAAFVGGAALVDPGAAHAQTAGMPARCYQWPADRIDLGWPAGAGYRTDDIMVTEGSPCLDINVRQVRDYSRPGGSPACRTLRVHWQSGAVGPWYRVCSRWTVLAYGAPEGAVYRVESKSGRPANVTVRG